MDFQEERCSGSRTGSTAFRFWRGNIVERIGVDIAPGTTEEEINGFRRRLTNLQKQARIPQAWLSVEESDGGVHKHFLTLANDEVVERLETSRRFQATAVGTPRFALKDAHASAAAYLTKEATPQAAYKNPAVPHRKRGSHRLPHGGDRVRVSKALEPYVEPWLRTNAKRTGTRKPYRKRQLARSKAPRPADQVVLPFDDGRVHRPVARLHDFGGGLMPTSVAREIEFQRRQAGLSQRDLAQRCGIGQPQLANALRGHDPVSSWVVARLRDALLEQAA